MGIKALAGIAVAATAATAALPAQAADDPVRKVVRIYDNFYTPDEMKVGRDTVVVWKWPSYSGDVHDVKLKSA